MLGFHKTALLVCLLLLYILMIFIIISCLTFNSEWASDFLQWVDLTSEFKSDLKILWIGVGSVFLFLMLEKPKEESSYIKRKRISRCWDCL